MKPNVKPNELKFNERQHAYWWNGIRCRGATTAAKIPDDQYRLNMYRARMILIGGARNPSIMERAAAHIDDRDKLDELAEEANTFARAHEKSGRGTAAHRIAERIDLGQEIVDTALAQAVQAAWSRALDDADLEIIPELVERIVVHPEHLIAGTFDRICRRREDGKHVIVDLKTGDNAVKYPHAIAIQLALYANAPLLAGPIPKGGGTTQHFEPLPELDREWGYIVHMPAENLATTKKINIAAGWEAAQQIVFPTLEWRARKDLVQDMISAAVWAPTPRLVTADGAVEPTQDPPPAPAPVPSTTTPTADRVRWVKAWIAAIRDAGTINELAYTWPKNVPLPKHSDQWTNDDIDKIAAACADIDANTGAPFWPPDPSTPTPTGIQTRS